MYEEHTKQCSVLWVKLFQHTHNSSPIAHQCIQGILYLLCFQNLTKIYIIVTQISSMQLSMLIYLTYLEYKTENNQVKLYCCYFVFLSGLEVITLREVYCFLLPEPAEWKCSHLWGLLCGDWQLELPGEWAWDDGYRASEYINTLWPEWNGVNFANHV